MFYPQTLVPGRCSSTCTLPTIDSIELLEEALRSSEGVRPVALGSSHVNCPSFALGGAADAKVLVTPGEEGSQAASLGEAVLQIGPTRTRYLHRRAKLHHSLLDVLGERDHKLNCCG
jgi:hypothetical protein